MKHIIYILLLFPALLFSQGELKGVIMEANEKDDQIPLPGANVYWLGTTIGASTDIDGVFTIPYKKAELLLHLINFHFQFSICIL